MKPAKQVFFVRQRRARRAGFTHFAQQSYVNTKSNQKKGDPQSGPLRGSLKKLKEPENLETSRLRRRRTSKFLIRLLQIFQAQPGRGGGMNSDSDSDTDTGSDFTPSPSGKGRGRGLLSQETQWASDEYSFQAIFKSLQSALHTKRSMSSKLYDQHLEQFVLEGELDG